MDLEEIRQQREYRLLTKKLISLSLEPAALTHQPREPTASANLGQLGNEWRGGQWLAVTESSAY
jgi:hypothetical protein